MLEGGAIMVVEVRHDLWRSWGLCPRHAWGLLAIELELRGGSPLTSTVLHEDLMGRAVRAMRIARTQPWPLARRRLVATRRCLTCDFVELAGRHGPADPLVEPGPAQRTAIAPMAELARTRTWIAAAAAVWSAARCPGCGVGGDGPRCRPHLLQGPAPRGERHRTLERLEALAPRVTRYGRSMTWRGPTARPEDRAALVEALGWMGGWGPPA